MLQYQINLASISKGRLKTQISGFQTTFARQTHIIEERYTGYTVSSVNINVQGIYADEPILPEETENPSVSASSDEESGKETPQEEGHQEATLN